MITTEKPTLLAGFFASQDFFGFLTEYDYTGVFLICDHHAAVQLALFVWCCNRFSCIFVRIVPMFLLGCADVLCTPVQSLELQ